MRLFGREGKWVVDTQWEDDRLIARCTRLAILIQLVLGICTNKNRQMRHTHTQRERETDHRHQQNRPKPVSLIHNRAACIDKWEEEEEGTRLNSTKTHENILPACQSLDSLLLLLLLLSCLKHTTSCWTPGRTCWPVNCIVNHRIVPVRSA